ncbi:molybdopterin-synthase adenylyltransferase MoeB [Parvularcula sp. IMCC14364]|uniref:HesA/MoeB/ThiF family protein n=1 Tax=Parvularcula sp. IMCC14364 TaxID=3067902 RepID=UPI0027427D15|nr:molybdopterin-synthase adenylyltransferase MoeB [Parvularcula sp. IMCC14364]
MSLTPDQIERYKRHILLPEIGGQGQQKLLAAKVLVIGAGGLGCPVLSCLAAAGVGTIGICDDDTVALSNLQRQTLYTTDDIGQPKVSVAISRLTALNPDIDFIAHRQRLTAHNAQSLVRGYDLILEGVDNFTSRYALNDACIAARKPLISAAIGKFDGQVASFRGYEEGQPCYQCFVPETPAEFANCELEGVVGAVPGTVGNLAAMEAIKVITGLASDLAGHILIYNGLSGETRRVKLPRDPACPAHRCDL